MNAELLKHAGQIAGLGGIALGVLLIVFREVLRKNIFPQIPKTHAYKIIRLIVILTFMIATLGITASVYVQTLPSSKVPPSFPKDDVDRVVSQYLALVDDDKFSEAWKTMAGLAHSRYQFESVQRAYQAQRTPLGSVVTRTISNVSPVAQWPDGTQGAFTVTSFVTKYKNGRGPYLEQVAVVAEDGTWRVFAHTTMPCPDKACPDPVPATGQSEK